MRVVIATPAYGRDYGTEEECRAAWNGGSDFRIQDLFLHGTYIGKQEAEQYGFTMQLRFNNMKDICMVYLPGQEPITDEITD